MLNILSVACDLCDSRDKIVSNTIYDIEQVFNKGWERRMNKSELIFKT